VNPVLAKIRAAANILMVCIAIERTVAAIKRDRRLNGRRRENATIRH
jgi:hypothetical protein